MNLNSNIRVIPELKQNVSVLRAWLLLSENKTLWEAIQYYAEKHDVELPNKSYPIKEVNSGRSSIVPSGR